MQLVPPDPGIRFLPPQPAIDGAIALPPAQTPLFRDGVLHYRKESGREPRNDAIPSGSCLAKRRVAAYRMLLALESKLHISMRSLNRQLQS